MKKIGLGADQAKPKKTNNHHNYQVIYFVQQTKRTLANVNCCRKCN